MRFNLRLTSIALILLAFVACGKESTEGPEKPEPPVDPPASGPIVKVMSYNIHIGNPPSRAAEYRELEAAARVINLMKPDLVALQEVDNKTNRSGSTVDQAQTLAELTGMHVFYTKAIDYDGGEFGDAVLSRFPILEKTRYELPVEGSGPQYEKRSLAVIKVEKEGKQFYFASTHLDHLGPENNRILQANEINKIVKNLSLPLILGGDLNAQPSSETIRILQQEFTNACVSGCKNTFPQDKPTRIIDYIFYRGKDDFKVKQFDVVNETYASDHLPIYAEIELL